MPWRGLYLLLVFVGLGCRRQDPPPAHAVVEPPPPQIEKSSAPAAIRAEMRNVKLHVDDTLTLEIRKLRGQLLPAVEGLSPSLDDKRSFTLVIDSGEIATSGTGLAYVLNHYVFAYPGAPVARLAVSMEGKQIKIKGTLRKKMGVSFEMLGDVDATADGKLRVHPARFKAAHLPVKGLLHFFGMGVGDVIDTRGARGVEVDKNDLILDPEKILPPPRMRGRLTRVRIEGDQMIEDFGTGGNEPQRKSNYIYLRGGTLGFGKLVMHDTDLLLEDAHPADPLGFYLDHYKEQLAAGYCKISRESGLHVFVQDYEKLKSK